MRTATIRFHGTVRVKKNRTPRSPRALTHTPMRSSRRAQRMTTTAMPRITTASDREPVNAMMTAANSTYDASSSTSAATATRHGPGR